MADMYGNEPPFILVINDEEQRTLINVWDISYIKEEKNSIGEDVVVAKIHGVEGKALLVTGEDSEAYFDWLMEQVDLRSIWEHEHAKIG